MQLKKDADGNLEMNEALQDSIRRHYEKLAESLEGEMKHRVETLQQSEKQAMQSITLHTIVQEASPSQNSLINLRARFPQEVNAIRDEVLDRHPKVREMLAADFGDSLLGDVHIGTSNK